MGLKLADRPGMEPTVVGRRGFTIVELLTILVLGMVLAVIGFSGTRLFDRTRPVESSARRFSHALSTARALAIARNGFFQVTLDLGERNFWVDEVTEPPEEDSLPGTAPGVVRPKVVPAEALHSHVRVVGVEDTGAQAPATSGLQRFVFGPDGSASRDSRIVFVHARDDPTVPGNLYTVRLYGPTGHNKLFERRSA